MESPSTHHRYALESLLAQREEKDRHPCGDASDGIEGGHKASCLDATEGKAAERC